MSGHITKNQHYVPQFLLSGFKIEESKYDKINIYDLERNQIRKNQLIKNIFSQNYFYDKDNLIENFLSSSIERPASKIINDVKKGKYQCLQDSNTALIKFFCCQEKRTVEARNDYFNCLNSYLHLMIDELNELNDLKITDVRDFSITPSDKSSERYIQGELALYGVINSKAMEDLEFHALFNCTKEQFIISDQALTKYNWLYRELDDPRVSSMLGKGVLLFLPISDLICICAYDPKSYDLKTGPIQVTNLYLEKDVAWINQLQMRSARSFVAFKSNSMLSSIKELKKRYFGKKVYQRASAHLGDEGIGSQDFEYQHCVYTTQVKLKEKPSFFRMLSSFSEHELEFEERDPIVSSGFKLLLNDFIRISNLKY